MKNKNFLSKSVLTAAIALAIIFAIPLSGFCYSGELEGADDIQNLNEGKNESFEVSFGGNDNEIYEFYQDESNTEAEKSFDELDSNTLVSGGNAELDTDEDDSFGELDSETDRYNVFESLYSSLRENLADILSALAFLGSVIVMLCYKKGLIPFIKEGLSALAAGVKSVSEKTAALDTDTEQKLIDMERRIEELSDIAKKVETAAESLMLSEEEKALSELDKRRFTSVLECQIDMLYEVLSAAALPQYLKERSAERISDMKKAVKELNATK